MSNVLGPYDREDFETMKQLKKSIEHLTKTNKDKYHLAIKGDTKLLKKYLSKAA
jgi:hypothetical protein